jgi:hypothetical protein
MSKKAKGFSILAVFVLIVACVFFASCTVAKKMTSTTPGVDDPAAVAKSETVADNSATVTKNSLFGNPYSVDYKLAFVQGGSGIKVTVKGPTARLAVILTDPKGQSNARFIERDEMIVNNCQTIELPMENIQAGTWILTVKTTDPEKIVCPSQKIELSPSQLTTVKNIGNDFTKMDLGHIVFSADALYVTVNKEGSLPIKISNTELTINGKRTYILSFSASVIIGQAGVVRISVGGEIFEPGERRVAKGKIFYDENRKSLEFEKELVAPQA